MWGLRSAPWISGGRTGQLDAGKVDGNVEGNVEIVGEEIERDMRELDDLLVVEAVIAKLDDVSTREMASHFDHLDREIESGCGPGSLERPA